MNNTTKIFFRLASLAAHLAQWIVIHTDGLLTDELVHVRVDQSPIPIIGHPSSVVGVTDQVPHGIEWGDIGVLVQEYDDEIVADQVVALVELVRDVESEGLKLPPLEKTCMEPRKRKDELR